MLRKLDGATKAQRKEFRAHEKVRHEGLDSESVGRIGCLRRPKVDGRDSARDEDFGGARMRGVGRSGGNQSLGRGSVSTVEVCGQQGSGSARGMHTGAKDDDVVIGRGKSGKGRGRIAWG